MLEIKNPIFQHEFPTWIHLIVPIFSLIPLKKATLWKVTKDTIDIEDEELFNYAKLRSKSLNLHLCIQKRNIMHLRKKRKIRGKRNSRMNKGLHLGCKKRQFNIKYTRMKLISVSHGLQFNKLLSFSSFVFFSINDLNPYKLPCSDY